MDKIVALTKEPEVILSSDPGELLATCRRYMARGYYAHALAYLYYGRILINGATMERASLLLMFARCTFELGKYGESEAAIREGKEVAERIHERDVSIALVLLEAHLKLVTNNKEEADSLITWALAMLESWFNRELEIESSILRSLVNRHLGYAEVALEFAQKALKALLPEHDSLLMVKAYHALAAANAEMGESETALHYFNLALEHGDIEGNLYIQAQILSDAGGFVGKELARRGSKLVVDPGRPPAWYFAKALTLFARCGTVRDLDRINVGFRKYGRRESDKLGNRVINERSGSVSYLQSRLAKSVDEHLGRMAELMVSSQKHSAELEAVMRSVITSYLVTHRTLLDLEAARRDLVETAKTMGVERNKLELLVTFSRKLTSITQEELLFNTMIDIIMEVTDAEGACFLPNAPESVIKGSIIRGNPGDEWHRLALRVLDTDEAMVPDFSHERGKTKGESGGRVIVLPVRAGESCYGALYADKRRLSSKFSRMDYTMFEALVLQCGTILDNFRMHRIMHTTASNMEATLDAISDGVVTLTKSMQIFSINRSALTMLDMPMNRVLGLTLGDLPGNWPEGGVKSFSERLVRLPRGEVLVNSRPLFDEYGERSGEVLTMTELRKVKRAVQSIAVTAPRYTFDILKGESAGFMAQVELAKLAAGSDSDILITGESGTGKEVFAQSIHNASKRKEGPFVALNCAAIPSELLESELFGYEEGAFTGASRGGKPGKFELAEGGTLLLDEIGDMPLEMQAKMLRVLQERRYRRVGGSVEYLFDVRIFSTTNRPLEKLVKLNQFRADLLYRLKVIHLHVPPLRERPDDIPLLIQFFLTRYANKMGKGRLRFSPDAMKSMEAYPWPGNIRELEHIIEAEVNMAQEGLEVISAVPLGIRGESEPGDAPELRVVEHPLLEADLSGSLDDMERSLLLSALRRTNFSPSKSAKELGVSRGTVYNKMKKFGIDLQKLKYESHNE